MAESIIAICWFPHHHYTHTHKLQLRVGNFISLSPSPLSSRYHVTLIGVRAEGAADLKLNPGLTHILQENDTVFYIGFTREEYSKVRGPVNVRHTLWHACATWAVIALATSGINPYEMEQKYGSHEVKVDQKDEVRIEVEQEEVTSVGTGQGDKEVQFYIGDRPSNEFLGSDLGSIGQKRPSIVSGGTPEDGSGTVTPMKGSLDDQIKCDVLRGVQLLRFHSQANFHSSVPVKVKLHRDSILQGGLQHLSSNNSTDTLQDSAQCQNSVQPDLAIHRQSSAQSGTGLQRQSSTQSGTGLQRQSSAQSGNGLQRQSSAQSGNGLQRQSSAQSGHALIRQSSSQSGHTQSSGVQGSTHSGSQSSTHSGSQGSTHSGSRTHHDVANGSERFSSVIPAPKVSAQWNFGRLSDVPEECSLEREGEKCADVEHSLREAEEGRAVRRNGHIPGGHRVQEGLGVAQRGCSTDPGLHIDGTHSTSIRKAEHAMSVPEVPYSQRTPFLYSQQHQTLVPPPLDLGITRSASDGRIAETLEEATNNPADPNTPVTLRRGAYYSSEMSLLNPSTPGSASRHMKMDFPLPRRRPSILENLSRKLSQMERGAPPVLQEEVRGGGGGEYCTWRGKGYHWVQEE